MTTNKIILIILSIIIIFHIILSKRVVEGLTNKIQNQVLLGVGAGYQLYNYIGIT